MLETLTTVERVKAWLAPDQGTLVSTNDEMIGRLVGAFSSLVLGAMNRDQLRKTARTETYRGGRTSTLLLRQWPVLSVESLGIGDYSAVPADYALETIQPSGGSQRIYLNNGRTFYSSSPAGIAVAYTTGFVTTQPVKVSSGSAPTFVTEQVWLADHGVTDINGAPISYTVDPTGLYTPSPALAGQWVNVTFSYVPMDIEQVVIDEIAASFKSRQRIGEASKAMKDGGTLSYLPRKLMDISVMALQQYTRVVPA